MSETCLVCLLPLSEDSGTEYHGRCAQRLFGSRQVPRLDVDPANLHLLGLRMAGRVSLSGVQRKLALEGDGGTLRVADRSGGRFILKPATESYPDLPQNEQLCMRLAGEAGLRVPESGLVRLSNGALAFLTRRFDRAADSGDGRIRKIPVEDFCQLQGRLPRDKYRGSYEQCGETLRQFAQAFLVDGAELFRLVLLCWWVGNNDLHLKNLSLIGPAGQQRLAPCYDIVCTAILGLPDELALTLEGKRSNLRSRDWLALAQRLGIPPRAVIDQIERLERASGAWEEMLEHLPMRADLKSRWLDHVLGRMPALAQLRDAALASDRRPPAKHLEARVPTGAEAGRTFHEFVSSLGAGACERDTPLGAALAELDWLARDPGPIFSPSRLDGPEQARTLDAFSVFRRLRAIGSVLASTRPLTGADQVHRHLRRMAPEPSGRIAGQAGDHLFELEAAGFLLASGRIEPEALHLGDTDLVWTPDEQLRIGIECRRPAAEKSLERCARKALDQLAERGLSGFALLGLDLFFRPLLLTPEDIEVDLRRARQSLGQYADRLRSAGVLDHRAASGDDASPLGHAGILLCTTALTLREAPHVEGRIVRSHLLVHPLTREDDPGIQFLGHRLSWLLASGADALER